MSHVSKSGLRNKFKTNTKLEIEGVWMDIPEATNEDGSVPAFLIARVGQSNMEHNLEVERLAAPYKGRTLKPEQNREITKAAFVKCGMKSWRNVQNDDGTPTDFTYENVMSVFDDMNDLYIQALMFGNDSDNYKAGALELAAKN